ncbi:MAG: helix-turn-helix transcriptional regulator [Verrucomicrobia bacterium]|nr:helix-turn-helix transcriptional regulator [Verrucomicrobiota bacterium]
MCGRRFTGAAGSTCAGSSEARRRNRAESEQAPAIKRRLEERNPLCNRFIRLFQLIANKARFRIICVLARGDFRVQEIAEITVEGQIPNISQRLRMLRLAKIVPRRREKRRIICRLADEQARRMIEFFSDRFWKKRTTDEKPADPRRGNRRNHHGRSPAAQALALGMTNRRSRPPPEPCCQPGLYSSR